MKGKSVYVLLFLILALGTTLRFYKINSSPVRDDEFNTRMFAAGSMHDVVERTIRQDTHSPLYYLVTNLSIGLLGNTKVALRLPALLSGVGAIFFMFLLGRKLYGDREGLAAAFLTAFFNYTISFSRYARSYSMLMLFSIITVYLLLDITLRCREGRRQSPVMTSLYTVCAVILAYVHYFGLFFVIFQISCAMVYLHVKKKNYVPLAWVSVAVFAAYACWIPSSLYQGAHNLFPSEAIPRPTAKGVLYYFYEVFNYMNRSRLVPFGVLVFGVIYALTHVRAWIQGHKDPVYAWADRLLMLWFILPFAIVIFESKFFVSVFLSHYLIFCLPALYLLLARAVVVSMSYSRVLPAVFLMVIMAQPVVSKEIYFVDYYAAYSLITKHPGDPLIVHDVSSEGATSISEFLQQKRLTSVPEIVSLEDSADVVAKGGHEDLFLVFSKKRGLNQDMYARVLQKYALRAKSDDKRFVVLYMKRKAR